MENKLIERKKLLEEEIKALIQQRNTVNEQMLKPAQQLMSEINKKHMIADSKYTEICELLGFDATKEWEEANKKAIPVETSEEVKK